MTQDWEPLAGLGFENFRLSHKDRALFFIENERDFEAQLYAITGALAHNREAEALVVKKIKAMDEDIATYKGDDDQYEMHLQNCRIDALQESVYSDAAHSMAAVGMLAPYFESLFVAIFAAIRKETSKDSAENARAKAFENLYWNPQTVISSNETKADLVRGIKELASEVGLSPHLPIGYEKTLTALFAYRNNMFHNGFEWPPEARQKFQTRIKEWPGDWFEHSSHGGNPWIFYLSKTFIEHCIHMVGHVLDGVGKYLEARKAN